MILQQLRATTHAEHRHLENRIDVLGRDWSLDFYRSLLEKFFGFYRSLEPLVWDFPQWQQLGFPTQARHKQARHKVEWLRQDLCFLGSSECHIESLQSCPFVPAVETFAQALGCAYVMEGSTLGGQMIARHLNKKLGVSAHQGCRFFSAYGERTGSMWREFIATLEAHENVWRDSSSESESSELAELSDSARATFSALDDWLDDIL